MAKHTLQERIIALGGLHLALEQVDRLAHRGDVDPDSLRTVIRSLFIITPERTIDVYGSLEALQLGLQSLCRHWDNSSPQRNVQMMRYLITLATLERSLKRSDETLQQLGDDIEAVRRQVEHFHPTHPAVIGHLADIYRQHISPLTPPVMVIGKEEYLQQAGISEQVRALLLAALRATILWRQCGGSRWQLLFRRSAYLHQARQMLTATPPTP
ncbi:lysogenization regulator HflD [Ectothiorhodospiraceae bacterium BW-2]|nr:lysogenization regulator HflD [Ectothiorhodospiraceae bacterium BW-2]